MRISKYNTYQITYVRGVYEFYSNPKFFFGTSTVSEDASSKLYFVLYDNSYMTLRDNDSSSFICFVAS